MHPANYAPIIITLVVMAFVMYRRARSHIGRQPLRPTRLKVRMGILSVIAIAILTLAHAPLLPALAGVVVGAAIAVLSLKHTHFERTPERVYYTPNIYIGIALTLLLIGRVATRMVGQMDAISAAQAGQTARPNFASAMGNPVTTGIFLLLVGYYLVYYTGILRTAAKLPTPAPEPVAPTVEPAATP
jgi:Protein of unknown function (DUF1453)